MKDIADKAGVARSTVSAVLNNTTYTRISPHKREEILRISKELNYRRNFAATALKERKTGLLGFVCGNLQNQFNSELTMAMAEIVEANGYELMLAVMSDDNKFDMKYFDRMLTDMCDGVFMCRDLRCAKPEIVQRIQASRTPFVFMESAAKDVSSVKFDMQIGMDLAFEELLANGHRKIAYANRERDFAKLEAYLNCCRQHGFEPLIYEFALEADLRDIFEFGRKIARNRHKYTALVMTEHNLEMMAGGFDAEGAKIPEDLSVIAFNDTLRSQVFRPPLTSISLSPKTLCRYAMDLMSSQIKDYNPDKTKDIYIPPQLVKRSSVKKLMK